MTLTDLETAQADHERGKWFDLRDPVDGTPTGIRLRIAGPDSLTQRRAELKMVDQLAEAADPQGRVSAETRERIRLEALAACVLDWELPGEDGPTPLTTANVLRLLGLARWVREQVDAFAGDRTPYRSR